MNSNQPQIRKKTLLLAFIGLVMVHTGISQNNPGLTFGGSNNDNGYALCLTQEGGYIISGASRSFSSNADDIYLNKISNSGNLIWSMTYGGPHQDFARSIISIDGGFLLLGDVWDGGDPRTSMYLCKMDLDGNKLWDKQFGTGYDEKGFKVKQAADGDFLLLGYSRGYDLQGDIFLVRTDGQGNELWNSSYGYERNDYAMDILENEDGTIMIAGTKNGFFNDVHADYERHDADMLVIKVDSEGQEIWRQLYGLDNHDFGYSINKTQDGGYYFFGSSQSYGEGSFDMLLIKINESGVEEWHRSYGGPEYEYGMSMDMNQNNELFMFGTTRSFGQNGSADFYLIKSDDQGNALWEITIGGDNIDYGYSVVATADSGCAVVGSSQSFGSGMFDVLFVKIDKNGLIENLMNGIDTLLDNQIVIAPNPISNTGHILLNEANMTASRTLEIKTINGSLIKKYRLTAPDLSFNVLGLPAAIYVYTLYSDDPSARVFRGKLIVR